VLDPGFFYNGSWFDNNSTGLSTADKRAIAPEKTTLTGQEMLIYE
jgi:hypothetical protein